MRYLGAIVLAILFSIGTFFSPFVMLLTLPWRGDVVFRAMNRLCGAAYFGFEGKNTISKECGFRLLAGVDCVVCRPLCTFLNWLLDDPRHCEGEAERG